MYGKIFEQIYDSSIAEDWTVRTVFQDFIVLADINGVVDRTPEAIARRTNVPLQIVQKAIARLESADPTSRSPDEHGARIRRLDNHREWGWEIINYQKYRDIASAEQQREGTKIRTRKWRKRKSQGNKALTKEIGDASVTVRDACDAMQKQKQKQKNNTNTEGECDPNCYEIPKANKASPTIDIQALKASLDVLMNRPRRFLWGYQEDVAVVEIAKRPDCESELAEIQALFTRSLSRKYLPQTMKTLLENWTGTLDRARMPAEQTRTVDEQKRDRAAVDMAVPKLPRNWMEL